MKTSASSPRTSEVWSKTSHMHFSAQKTPKYSKMNISWNLEGKHKLLENVVFLNFSQYWPKLFLAALNSWHRGLSKQLWSFVSNIEWGRVFLISKSTIRRKGMKIEGFSSFFSDKSIPSGQNYKDDPIVSYMVRKLLMWRFLVIFSKISWFENMSARIFTTLQVPYGGEILDSLICAWICLYTSI